MDETFERLSPLDFSSHHGDNTSQSLFDVYEDISSGKIADVDVQMITALRKQHPELIVTTVPTGNVSLLQFAAAGYATAKLDLDHETVIRWRGFVPPRQRGGSGGGLADATFFARYRYKWGDEDFLLYTVQVGLTQMQYVLKEPRAGEKIQDNSKLVDALLLAIGSWRSIEPDALYVFDRYWTRSTEMWKEVQKASWDRVILDSRMKKELVSVCDTFFDSKDTYAEYGVPWKRGLIFHGPPGNGKTISIKALMHSMYQRKAKIPCLYVKSATQTYMIASIFQFARTEAPCLLIFEDIDTIVNSATRSFFFNEVDGVSSNDGIMMIASTNYLDRLDPGLTKRPSRFDRKYLFPMPNKAERVLYAQFWQKKLKGKPVEFPDEICPAVAEITEDFSFAYMQELFISSMLQIARGDDGGFRSVYQAEGDLDQYQLWRVLKQQAAILREDMGKEVRKVSAEHDPFVMDNSAEPHGKQTELDIPFPLSSRGLFSRRETRMSEAQPWPVHRGEDAPTARRLTPEEALHSLTKTVVIGDKAFDVVPVP